MKGPEGRPAGCGPRHNTVTTLVAHLVLCPARYAGSPNFGPPRPAARGAKRRVLTGLGGSVFWRDAQAGVPSARRPRAQLAFKNSMVRGILQFTPGIAFCYVLHRCESRDIRCRESCGLVYDRCAWSGRQAGRPARGKNQCSLAPVGAVGSFAAAPLLAEVGGLGAARRGRAPSRGRTG
jgi:hypothetical protein